MEIKFRFGFCVQVDGLDVEGLKKDLENFGQVTDIVNFDFEDDDGDIQKSKIFIVETNKLFNKMLCKNVFNCYEQNNILFPMEQAV